MLAAILKRPLALLYGGLGVAFLACSIIAWVQTNRLKISQHELEVTQHEVASLKTDIASRDLLIDKQNKAVLELQQRAEVDRKAYLSRLDTAQRLAIRYRGQASDIMNQQTDSQDELERSRAALRLILDLVGKQKQ